LPLAETTFPSAADTDPSPPIAPETAAAKYLSVVSSTPSLSTCISRRAGTTTFLAVLSSSSLLFRLFNSSNALVKSKPGPTFKAVGWQEPTGGRSVAGVV
jgi:hypothetical protein